MLKRRALYPTFGKKYRKSLNFSSRPSFEARTFFATDVFKSTLGVALSLRPSRSSALF